VEGAIAAVRSAVDANDSGNISELKKKVEELRTASLKIGEVLWLVLHVKFSRIHF
jgi:hypothetical protein